MTWHKRELSQLGIFEGPGIKCWLSLAYQNFQPANDPTFYCLQGLYDNFLKRDHGFDWHKHENLEILSIPIAGTLHHQDSHGLDTHFTENQYVYSSAGTGFQHRETSSSQAIHDLRYVNLWFQPTIQNTKPYVQARSYLPTPGAKNISLLVASPNSSENPLFVSNFSARILRHWVPSVADFQFSATQPRWFFALKGSPELPTGSSLYSHGTDKQFSVCNKESLELLEIQIL